MPVSQFVARAFARTLLGRSETGLVTPASTFVELRTADPGPTGASGAAVAGVGVQVPEAGVGNSSWSDPTDATPSVSTNVALLDFGTVGAGGWNGGTQIDWFAIWNHATDRTPANFLGGGQITGGLLTVVGNQVVANPGQLSWRVNV